MGRGLLYRFAQKPVRYMLLLYTTFRIDALHNSVLIPNEIDLRFESNMTVVSLHSKSTLFTTLDLSPKSQHKHYNTLLNTLKTSSDQPSHPSSPLSYAHRYLVDSFYTSDNPRDREKIRVTRDEKTGTVTECMRKKRLGDLNIYCPKRTADWRISVNLESPGQVELLKCDFL